jgi:hypothetical protein
MKERKILNVMDTSTPSSTLDSRISLTPFLLAPESPVCVCACVCLVLPDIYATLTTLSRGKYYTQL